MPPDVAVVFFIRGRGGRELPRNVASKESLMGDREARRSSGNQYGDFLLGLQKLEERKAGGQCSKETFQRAAQSFTVLP